MHARKAARDAYFPTRGDDAFFSPRGDVVFDDSSAARRFAERVNTKDGRTSALALRPAEVAAMSLVHEIFHVVVGLYRRRFADSFARLRGDLHDKLGSDAQATLVTFLASFPTPPIYAGEDTPQALLAREREPAEDAYSEEVLLLWLMNQNPAYEPVRPIVTDADLGPAYRAFVGEARHFFANEVPFGPRGETLMDLLLAPSRAAPGSIFAQLAYIEENWGRALGLDQLGIWRRILWARDFLHEEGRWFSRGGPGMGEPLLDAMRFGHHEAEPKRFSPDLDWMPRVVLVAKTAYVWLDQLSKKYQRHIHRLDQIPDEELDMLASRGFTGLWLIGLFERSRASRKIKQMRGDHDAVASAYSLRSYTIADELGGHDAYENLKHRAWHRGLRLAADMVPNHVGIDADWVIDHPDWFLQVPHPPFPSYRFGGQDLSEDPRVGVFIEEGYWNHTDAAVVFRRHDRWTGSDTFIYHGNDGTSMPWNDTAQLDYTRAEVRHAVIETILHVARMFPIIRFDAAMTLAKRHYKRLWFPFPGAHDGIPSRADRAMTQEEFDRVFPVEFWREVVDTVAARAPDTLLLAEAFWMMEGYFVRSLGMHRVYNSAFMNMLKREENQKYRETIKNVLAFEPEILKRFVNFMNNPDEDTAIAQFGSDDKYFGVCTLMATMPGLPMFGHGQVEGLHEKYGMEYRRAKWDESPNDWLVARHEREIFPLLKRRYLFSGVADFALYDFCTEGGGVAEDVFAYTNRCGDERALVLYNNKFSNVRGRLHGSLEKRGDDGGLYSSSVGDALGLHPSQGDWLVFRDVQAELDYVRPMREVTDGGFFWELDAFKYHVFEQFRGAFASAEMPYDRLAAELSGRGVPSIERALTELRFRPVHTPLREATGPGHLGYLAGGWDAAKRAPKKEALAALDERIVHISEGLAYMRGATIDAKPVLANARARYAAILAMANASASDPKAIHRRDAASATREPTATAAATADVPAAATDEKLDVALLLAWLHVEAALDLAASLAPTTPREALASTWELALPLVDAFSSSHDVHEAMRRAALVLVAATLPAGPLRASMRAALGDARAAALLGVHEAGGVAWLVKEPFEALAELLAERETVLGKASLAFGRREAEDVLRVATAAGWRAKAIAVALADKPPVTPSSSAS